MPVRKLLIRNLLFLGITGGLGAVGIAVNLNLPGAGFGTVVLYLLASILVIAGMFTGWGSYLLGADRRALERLCAGQEPRDGCLEAISGVVVITTDPLSSPLTATPCAAYEYSIHRARQVHHTRGGGRRRRDLCFDGRHLTDTFLESGGTRIRIASMPSLEEFICEHPDIERAEAHGKNLSGNPRTGFFKYLLQRRAANRGNYHTLARDWCLRQPRQWDERVELEERALPTGIEVSATGFWNASLGQLETPYPWRFSRISMERGDADSVCERIGQGAYQLARVSLWCLGVGYVLFAVMPLKVLIS